MRITLLGPVSLRTGDTTVAIPRARIRGMLALLALNAGRPLSHEFIIEALWGGNPPQTARAQVHSGMWAIRGHLATIGQAGAMVKNRFGYHLEVAPETVDSGHFTLLVRQARRAATDGDHANAVRLLRIALAQWQGDALADASGWFVEATRAQLDERRLTAIEDLADIELTRGDQRDLAAELAPLLHAHPFRERMRGQLMVALHRDGRQTEALALYRSYRSMLAERDGLDPGAQLVALANAILRDELDATIAPRDAALVATDPPPAADVREPTAEAPPADRTTPESGQANAPAQLPPVAGTFVGRAADLSRMDALLTGDQIGPVIITAIDGTAGVGKTALAIQWGHRVRDQFPDGQLYVNLHGYASDPPRHPREGLARLLYALGVPPTQVPSDVDDASGLYRTLLANKRVLVLIDNARDCDQVRPLLPGGDSCRVVITSRDELAGLVARDGARQLTLHVLAAAESLALLAAMIGDERVAAEEVAASELARLCAQLPLALRIAAANLAGRPDRTIADYVDDLRGDGRLTKLTVAADEPSAVRPAFALSYLSLTEPVRRLFRLIGSVPGHDITAQAAAAAIEATVDDARSWLAELVRAHLLEEPVPGRFACHDLLRTYARELAAETDTAGRIEAVRERLLGWYVRQVAAAADRLFPNVVRLKSLAPSSSPQPPTSVELGDPATAMSWLRAEESNISLTVRSVADDAHPAAWLLTDGMRGYLSTRGDIEDWQTMAGCGLSAARLAQDVAGQAASELGLAHIAVVTGRYVDAIAHYHEALRLGQECGWPEVTGAVHTNLGAVYARMGRLQAAADEQHHALAVHRRSGSTSGQAVTLGNLGGLFHRMGQLRKAAETMREALEAHRRAAAAGGEALQLNNIGIVHRQLGEFDDSLNCLTESLAIFRRLDSVAGEGMVLCSLADLYRDAGKYSLASEHAELALALPELAENQEHRAGALLSAAAILAHQGVHSEAGDRFAEVAALAAAAPNEELEAEGLIGLALTRQHLADPNSDTGTGTGSGLQAAQQALLIARRSGFIILEAEALTALASIYLRLGEVDPALAHATSALKLCQGSGHRHDEAACLRVLGDAHFRQGDPIAAANCWSESDAILDKIGFSAGSARHPADS